MMDLATAPMGEISLSSNMLAGSSTLWSGFSKACAQDIKMGNNTKETIKKTVVLNTKLTPR